MPEVEVTAALPPSTPTEITAALEVHAPSAWTVDHNSYSLRVHRVDTGDVFSAAADLLDEMAGLLIDTGLEPPTKLVITAKEYPYD